ncbi:MAG: hypothetical protein ACT4PP_16175 [Sporichthyaceae bacterium]
MRSRRAGVVREWRTAGDRGSAMILTTMVIVLVTTLAGLGTTMAIRDLRGAGHAQQAGTALGSAEAGVAHAITYIRARGVRKLACYPACTTNPWNPTTPVTASTAGGGRWTAWIAPLSVGNGDGGDTYLVHSTGTAGGPAERTIEVEISVTPIDLPKAVFGRTIGIGGTVDLKQISMFSTGCVYKRNHITVDASAGPDVVYNVPAAVHSAQIITESQGSGQYCANTAKPIHGGLNLAGVSLLPCNSKYPFDQDRFGGSLTDLPLLGGLLALAPCAPAATNEAYLPRDLDLDGSLDINGSFISDERALFRSFGISRPALSEAEIEQLRTIALAQGNYYTSTTGWSTPNGTVHPHSILFFDLAANQTVDLDPLGTSLWSRTRLDVSSPLCLDASLLVVVAGGNAKLNSNMNLAASIYLAGSAPGGRLTKGNGTINHVGMLYADALDLAGNFNVSLDTCYLGNPPPGLFDVKAGTYRELDR